MKAALTAHPLIELIEGQRVARGERIDFISIEVFVGWTMGRGDGRWPGRLAKAFEDPLIDRQTEFTMGRSGLVQ